MISEAPVTVLTADGPRLEAAVAVPPGAGAGVVLCHPHPLYGGDMDNPVVIRAAEVAREHGLATLRFNFRGVGSSTGEHGGGQAEQLDARAALDDLRHRLAPPATVLLVGYSFGAAVSARVAADGGIAALGLIAPPLARLEPTGLPDVPATLPLLVVAGSEDELCPRAALDRLQTRMPHARLEVIDGANHFFFGKLYPLGQAIGAWLERIR